MHSGVRDEKSTIDIVYISLLQHVEGLSGSLSKRESIERAEYKVLCMGCGRDDDSSSWLQCPYIVEM